MRRFGMMATLGLIGVNPSGFGTDSDKNFRG
jgi:hypothetical protein